MIIREGAMIQTGIVVVSDILVYSIAGGIRQKYLNIETKNTNINIKGKEISLIHIGLENSNASI